MGRKGEEKRIDYTDITESTLNRPYFLKWARISK